MNLFTVLNFAVVMLWSLGSAAQVQDGASFKCPAWLTEVNSDLPLCPEGEEQMLLPETYPVAAVVVSDNGMRSIDSEFTADVVLKTLKASGEKNPMLILPVSNETLKKINSKINDLEIDEKQKQRWKESLLHVPTRGYTWQQDYMQSFVDPRTGKIVIKEVEDYGRHGDSFKKIAQAVESCGLSAGSTLKTNGFTNGHMGGNIEALPGGVCLLGDDAFGSEKVWTNYADQICGKSSDDRIKVPTSWLSVGHTDEIMKVVRNKRGKAPCDFSIAFASPDKALELLKQNPDTPFLDFSRARGGNPKQTALRRSTQYRGLFNMCMKNIKLRSGMQKRNDERKRATRGIAQASGESSFKKNPPGGTQEDCSGMTNADAYTVFTQDQEFSRYNSLVQESMNSLKAEVSAKMKSKFPSCSIDTFEVPDLFFGGQPVEVGGAKKYELPRGMGLSILPNPTNAISVNDTIISPDPSNSVFKDYIENEYNKRGLSSEFVDTFDYAHIGSGNLHCATNTMHTCKPRGNK